MRSPEEIENWLIWNGCWQSYKRHAEASGMGYTGAIAQGRDAIKEAFLWQTTPEGDGYWWDINTRYVEWYDSAETEEIKRTKMKYKITRATVIKENMPVETYDNLNDTISPDDIKAYKEKIKARYAEDVRRMDVDLVYKVVE